MNILCDLCSGDDLEIVYTPPTTKRGLSVYICSFCGLMQSIPRIDHVIETELEITQINDNVPKFITTNSKKPSTSSGANWGNVRYGKQFDVDEAVEILSGVLDEDATNRMLDVGAGDGSFAFALSNKYSNIEIDMIEPNFDEIFDKQTMAEGVWIKLRWEDVWVDSNLFDAITFIHTLEHLRSPREALKKAYAALKDWGWLLVIVPNTEYLLEQKDIVEELFIDKHLYHFAPTTLAKYFYDTGFGIVNSRYSNRETIVYLGQKRPLSDSIKQTVSKYKKRLQSNTDNLPLVANKIYELMKTNDVVIWGLGRIFDALRQAGFPTEEVFTLVDKHLYKYIEKIDGRAIQSPDELDPELSYLIVICSREYAQEIKVEAEELCPNAEIIVWSDLLR